MAICTMVVWCGDQQNGAVAHFYDEMGRYAGSAHVSSSFCCGGTSTVVWNVGMVVANPTPTGQGLTNGTGRPVTVNAAGTAARMAAQFESIVVAPGSGLRDHPTRYEAEQAWKSGRALRIEIPRAALSQQAVRALTTIDSTLRSTAPLKFGGFGGGGAGGKW